MSKTGLYSFRGYDADGELIVKVVERNFDVGETKALQAFERANGGHIAVYKNGALFDTAKVRIKQCQ